MKFYSIVVVSFLSLNFIPFDKPVRKVFRYCKTIESAYVNSGGLFNGKFERIYNGHVVEDGQYDDGLKTGTWTSMDVNGKVVKKVNYKSNALDGPVLLTFPDGKPRVTGRYNDGLKVGTWIFYDRDNHVVKKGVYADNVPKGVWVYYDNQQLIEQYDFDSKKELVNNRQLLRFSQDEIKFKSSYMDKNYYYREVIDVPVDGVHPLGGYRKTKEYFGQNFEIPQDVWFTTISQTYFTTYKILNNGAFGDITVTRIKKSYLPYKTGMDYSFNTFSNNGERLVIDERTLYHLADKIKEDFDIFYGPWIVTTGENVIGSVQMNFVINLQF
jgi:antitoxin component YwqK of YwqJK toxin-antitoxin module